MSQPLLSVRDLVVEYPTRHGPVRALGGVSLDVHEGECVGVVGESGSGKSTLGKAILGLAPITAGTVTFGGVDIGDVLRRRGVERRALARDLQVVFQDPYGSLNPWMTVGQNVADPLMAGGVDRTRARATVAELLDRVRLPADAIDRYPSEFSGGQRQRVAIARALVRRPKLVVCDEPVSALDLTTQAAIVDLFVELQRETGVAYLFVSHDLAVVRRVSHRVAVMYGGEIVETGDAEVVTRDPAAAYSRRLLLASPVADPTRQAARRAAWLAERSATRASVQ